MDVTRSMCGSLAAGRGTRPLELEQVHRTTGSPNILKSVLSWTVVLGFVLGAALPISLSVVSGTANADDGLTSPWFGNHGGGRKSPWSLMIFGGQLSENELADIIIPDSSVGARWTDTSFIGAALSKEVYRWNGFSVELEGGLGYQFGGLSESGTIARHKSGAPPISVTTIFRGTM